MLRNTINLIQLCSVNPIRQNVRPLFISATNEAARKGTREKARKKKVKVEIKKLAYSEKLAINLRRKLKISNVDKHVNDSLKRDPIDDVYIGKSYKWKVYTFAEAIQCHRETHHPTIYNVPNAPLIAEIELNMKAEKGIKMVDNFQRTAPIKHKFDHGEDRTILVFAKGQENIEVAKKAGASLSGGPELIKDIQNGDLKLTDYQYVIAHPNILPDLAVVRGLLKKKFPNPKTGTLGPELDELIQRFMIGIQYSAKKDEHQKDFGLVTTTIGTLDMDSKHLEENLESLLKDIDSMRPKRAGKFIERVLLKCAPSQEILKINPFVYVPEERQDVKAGKKSVEKEDEQDEENELNAKAVN